jgi:energy-coupling factor transport system permease protein
LGTLALFIIQDSFKILIVSGLLLILLVFIYPHVWKVRGFRLAFLTGLLLLILHILFNKGGQILVAAPVQFLTVTEEGLGMGLRISGRFLAIIFLSYIFILTTDPNHLAYAFMKLGLPYRLGFMLVTALRLAPILEEEGRTIYKAQLVRGVQYDRQGLNKILLYVQQFFSPVLFSAIKRAEKLDFSMEGRGFGRYPTRTFRDQTNPTSLDIYASIGLVIFLFLLFWIKI